MIRPKGITPLDTRSANHEWFMRSLKREVNYPLYFQYSDSLVYDPHEFLACAMASGDVDFLEGPQGRVVVIIHFLGRVILADNFLGQVTISEENRRQLK